MNLSHIRLDPIWFDSLGAKSMCTLVETPDVSVLIDPGAAIMHPSFPLVKPQRFWAKMPKSRMA